MGGGWRQAGYLAAAGIYALDHHINRLKEDHLRAKAISKTLGSCHFVLNIHPVETNIVIFQTNVEYSAKSIVEKLAEKNIQCIAINSHQIRMVTHLDFTDDDLEITTKVLKEI